MLVKKLPLILPFLTSMAWADLSSQAQDVSNYAVANYHQAQIHTLGNLVSFPTVKNPQFTVPSDPNFIAFKQYLALKAKQLGFKFEDHGYTVLISYGEQDDKITVVTHGDVQPADASKWKSSPFELDSHSEPGKLIARGSEDDKGPIATALYAMKAIKDNNVVLKRRLELMIYLAEESDWAPLELFMQDYQQPDFAVTIDASYPVVVAEKGWCSVKNQFPDQHFDKTKLYAEHFRGGAFASQIPEDAYVTLHNVTANQLAALKNKAQQINAVAFEFTHHDKTISIHAKGRSAHSSEPESGINAIAYLAHLLGDLSLEMNASGQAINYVNELIGLDLYGSQFGKIAYSHDFMGPMTVAPTLLTTKDLEHLTLTVNLRRPVGKDKDVLEQQIVQAVDNWQVLHQLKLPATDIVLSEPMLLDDAPHAKTLLAIFSHYSGQKDAKPVSIGGGTNAKLFKRAVSFGPSMPGKAYTGHSEHEFITQEQIKLNLQMYTAMMIEVANL
ncbi:dipeptidase [Pseudoalteromonas tunicata]|uniref:dipeptidase n=1 Tax=Pseudoalteromonas tunicata TaxID=314281 RepID=UPI00351B68C9